MKKIIFALIVVLVVLTSISLVCASDLDNTTINYQPNTQSVVSNDTQINNEMNWHDNYKYYVYSDKRIEIIHYDIYDGTGSFTVLLKNETTKQGIANTPIILNYGFNITRAITDSNGYVTFTIPYNHECNFIFSTEDGSARFDLYDYPWKYDDFDILIPR